MWTAQHLIRWIIVLAVGVSLAGIPAAAQANPVIPIGAATCPLGAFGPGFSGAAKADGGLQPGDVVGVRVGVHPCFDRLVIDTSNPTPPGFTVAYVPTVTQDGSGRALVVPGGARLLVVIKTNGHDVRSASGRSTFFLNKINPGLPVFRSIVRAGDFEGQQSFGLGVRAYLPFRVFTLRAAGPRVRSMVVIDVARKWD